MPDSHATLPAFGESDKRGFWIVWRPFESAKGEEPAFFSGPSAALDVAE